MNTVGVYVIENKITGHRYVGSARRMQDRMRQHLQALRRGDHHSVVLQRAHDKHGADALSFKPLLVCEKRDLLFYEQRALDVYQPEYNILRVAGSRLGHKLSGDALARHTERMRSRPMTEPMRAHLASLAEKARGKPGRKPTPETIEKIKAARSRQVITDEHRAKIGAASRGRLHTPETKAKIAAAKSGVKKPPMTDAHRASIAAAMTGRRLSPASIEKLRTARTGRAQTAEHRAAIAAGHQRRRERLAAERNEMERLNAPDPKE
jgi:group I intron endonuclease